MGSELLIVIAVVWVVANLLLGCAIYVRTRERVPRPVAARRAVSQPQP